MTDAYITGDSQQANVLEPVKSPDEEGKPVFDTPTKPRDVGATIPSISSSIGSSHLLQAQFTDHQVGTS